MVWREEKLEQLQVSADELQPIRFQGQSFDQETGLHYNRFRYFDPDLGMFTTRDPIGLMGGSNVFQYAPNPTGWIDPFGLKCTVKSQASQFNKYKNKRGGTRTLGYITTPDGKRQRISIEFHHVFLTQRLQRRFNLPNWLVNNRINVWKLNTIQHAIIDKYRFKFLNKSVKPLVGFFKKYGFFTKF